MHPKAKIKTLSLVADRVRPDIDGREQAFLLPSGNPRPARAAGAK